MSRIVGQNAAIRAAVRRHYYQQPRSSRFIAPPTPPIIEVTLVAVETVHGWHLPGDHDNPIDLMTEGAVIGLFLVVIIVGFWTSISYVRRSV